MSVSTTASVSISRASLGLGPLVIDGDGDGLYTLTAAGVGRPILTARYTYADSSPDVEGSLLLQAVKDASVLPLEVLVQAGSSSDLEDALGALEDALWQFTYTTTVTVGGVSRSWRSLPTVPQAGDGTTVWAKASQHLEVVTISIPVQPTPGE